MFRNEGILLATVVAGLTVGLASLSAEATLLNLRKDAAGTPSLVHQWTFEGATDVEQRQDKQGSANLSRVTKGGGTAAGWVPGFGNDGQAAETHRSAQAVGGAYRSSSFAVPTVGTVEYLYRPDIAGGHFVSMNASGGNRLYFGLYSGNEAGAAFGNASWPEPFRSFLTNTSSPDLELDHWYYVAEVYEHSTSPNQFAWDVYLADLTEGQRTLTPGYTATQTGGAGSSIGSTALAIGMQNSGGGNNFSEGDIDELAWYNEKLPVATLQQHLDAIYIPEPSTLLIWTLLAGLGIGGGWRRRRK